MADASSRLWLKNERPREVSTSQKVHRSVAKLSAPSHAAAAIGSAAPPTQNLVLRSRRSQLLFYRILLLLSVLFHGESVRVWQPRQSQPGSSQWFHLHLCSVVGRQIRAAV